MSKIEVAAQEDFDFWEFVTCSRCLLPFNLDPSGAPSVPFWLTECGHVLCNNHISNAFTSLGGILSSNCACRARSELFEMWGTRYTSNFSAVKGMHHNVFNNTHFIVITLDGPTDVYVVHRGSPIVVRNSLRSIGMVCITYFMQSLTCISFNTTNSQRLFGTINTSVVNSG